MNFLRVSKPLNLKKMSYLHLISGFQEEAEEEGFEEENEETFVDPEAAID